MREKTIATIFEHVKAEYPKESTTGLDTLRLPLASGFAVIQWCQGAAILPPLLNFHAIAESKKATLRWLFLFPNSLNYQQVLYGAQGGT
ncbi:hypothetical protein [Photorhabdus khanii]|uniref:Uncharacterized protein n=1 Tax=Photorhabdus khanii subsp. guanajuatensis TaxID=2100166 RepID=A0A4R4ITH8_9GAMM|nr:hypothetical protein [Photorhabdus khanii]TDB44084.1 hypothetical protein C5467_23025 [Photorhabdus khanii subsp. guanajuatensis]